MPWAKPPTTTVLLGSHNSLLTRVLASLHSVPGATEGSLETEVLSCRPSAQNLPLAAPVHYLLPPTPAYKPHCTPSSRSLVVRPSPVSGRGVLPPDAPTDDDFLTPVLFGCVLCSLTAHLKTPRQNFLQQSLLAFSSLSFFPST